MLELTQVLFNLLSIIFSQIGKLKKYAPSPSCCPNLNPFILIIGTIIAGRKSQVRYIKARKPLADLSLNTTRKACNSKEWEAEAYSRDSI